MQSGDLLTGDVSQYHSHILVNGVERPHSSWDVKRAINGDLPAQVVAGSGITQATGSIAWARAEDVVDRELHPWARTAGWPPKSGDRVQIYASDGVTEWPVFTGRIDETTGDVGSGMESSIVDDIDQLNVRFRHDPMLRVMPPRFRAEPDWRGIQLTPIYYVDAALRKAGFYATPEPEPRCALSVPGQSSVWPEVGILTASGGYTADSTHAENHNTAPWGYSIGDFHAEYQPQSAQPPQEPVQLTMMVAPDHAGNAFLSIFYSEDKVTLGVTSGRVVIARANGVEVCRLTLGAATIVTLSINGTAWTLRDDTGAEATGTATLGTASMHGAIIDAEDGARVAGFQVSHFNTSSEFQSVEYSPTAVYHLNGTTLISILDAAPYIEWTTVIDLLKQISEAMLTAMWFDESGVFHWAPSDVLRAGTSAQTITTLDDIRSLSWQDALLSVRSGVDIDYRRPAISVSRFDNVTLYQGSGVTLESEQDHEEFASAGDDADWIQVQSDIRVFGVESGTPTAANNGWDTLTGAVLVDDTTEELGGNDLHAASDLINPNTLRIRNRAGILPAGKQLQLRFPASFGGLRDYWLEEPFPIVRGFGRVDWVDMTHTSPITGPKWAPVLVHEVGPWMARTAETRIIERLADYLAEQVTKPAPSITGMRVNFDPRRQLGDVITVVSDKLLGLELVCLIVDIQNSADESYTQTLGVRIISAKSTTATFGEFEAAYADDLTFEQWRALRATTDTFADFNTDPLEGA